ncbi:hypothetical protein D1872_239400 [compost metagenome]
MFVMPFGRVDGDRIGQRESRVIEKVIHRNDRYDDGKLSRHRQKRAHDNLSDEQEDHNFFDRPVFVAGNAPEQIRYQRNHRAQGVKQSDLTIGESELGIEQREIRRNKHARAEYGK